MKTLRKIHLYLGCLFAPLLIFFLVSGAFQVFHLHAHQKNGYQPPAIIEAMSNVHTNHKRSLLFRIFVVGMVLGLLTTIALGVIMAFRFTPNKSLVWLCLILGIFLPILLWYLK